MKTFTTTIIAILLFNITCKAQWTAGTGIITTTNSVGIGITPPLAKLHVTGAGVSVDAGNAININANGLAIQGNTGGRSATLGAQLEFVIPANTDGTNFWGQARIITVAGSAATTDATGKMILGTRRMFNKLGTGSQFYYGNDITIDGVGNVGIGTANPLAYYHIVVPSAKAISTGSIASFMSTNDPTSPFGLRTMIYGAAAVANRYITMQTTDFNLIDGGNVVLQPTNGNVGVGTTTPDQKLTVNGTVHSKAVVVDNNIFPDYVFNKTYALRPLSAVKTYIDLNHHLPEMPSAAEVAKNGQNLGEINTLLLKKVEELTLYMIEKDKQDEKKTAQLTGQQMQIDMLKQQLIELKKSLNKN